MAKATATVPCPECDEGEITVTMHYLPGTYIDPPESSIEIQSQTCQCEVEDSDLYEAAEGAAEGPEYDADERDYIDTIEERDM